MYGGNPIHIVGLAVVLHIYGHFASVTDSRHKRVGHTRKLVQPDSVQHERTLYGMEGDCPIYPEEGR